jgi:hypothetical protein
MPTSHYFPINYGGYKGEQNLIQDLVDEQIKLFGTDVYYLPRTVLQDNPLNDIVYSEFNQKIVIEMLLQNVEGFGSPSEFISKFGLKITDEIKFIVSKRRWEAESKRINLSIDDDRPVEGDLIYFPLTKNLYEIKFVEVERVFYQLGELYFYDITAEIYEIGNEQIDVGVEEIDLIDDVMDPAVDYVMATGGSGLYEFGELVEGSISGFTAKVKSWDPFTRTLTVIDRTGNFVDGEALVGNDSNTSWSISSFSTIEDANSKYDDNKYIENKGNQILDFSEINPFGEYGNIGDDF